MKGDGPCQNHVIKTFEELTFEEQAYSINATIINLHNVIKRHVKDAPNPIKAREKCIEQIGGLFQQLIKEAE
ncbi:MAG: hypothetical protein GY777_02090 [Candidatus Brocadiaceae bacterium]|nr:hypothetical protein [Candidatus Brocadiaceae bacterium]